MLNRSNLRGPSMWYQLKRLSVAAIMAWSITSSALAREIGRDLMCNKKQTKCLTESTDLTIGDQVGIFNDEGELVATGEVKAMRGDRRAVLINTRHGDINSGYHLALLETGKAS